MAKSVIMNRIYHNRYNLLLLVFLFPLYVPLSAILYICNIRFIRVNHTRIGHLIVEPEIFQKKRMLGLESWCFTILLAPKHEVSNPHFLLYIDGLKKFKVITSRVLCFLLQPFGKLFFLTIDTSSYASAFNETSEWSRINKLWDNRPPIMSLTQEDMHKGSTVLRYMGVPEDAWFVCIHSREGGYSPKDEHLHSFRNGDINSYIQAMEMITAKGGWCFRMGDPTMKKLPPLPNVIDYAHSTYRSDCMDVFLCGKCSFFVGTASGLSALASVFGVPIGLTNLVPLSMALPPGLSDRGITKLYWSEKENRVMRFQEVFDTLASNYRLTDLFMQDGIRLVDNTSEEIKALFEEMYAITIMKKADVMNKTSNPLQDRFSSFMRPGHFTYGALGKIGEDFLIQHKSLL